MIVILINKVTYLIVYIIILSIFWGNIEEEI